MDIYQTGYRPRTDAFIELPLLPGGMPNASGALAEDRRRQRIFNEFHGIRPLTNAELWDLRTERNEREIRAPAREALHAKSTAYSNCHIQFHGKQYTLPPSSGEFYEADTNFSSATAEFMWGGLGFKSSMFEDFKLSNKNAIAHNRKIRNLNEEAEKKAKKIFGFGKKKDIQFYQLLPENYADTWASYKLAAARVPMTLEMRVQEPNDWTAPFAAHPSSLSQDPLQDLQDFANAHWVNVPEQPWKREILTQFPLVKRGQPVPSAIEFQRSLGQGG